MLPQQKKLVSHIKIKYTRAEDAFGMLLFGGSASLVVDDRIFSQANSKSSFANS